MIKFKTEHFVFLGIFGFHVLLNFTYFLCSLNVKCIRLDDDHLIWKTYRGEEKFFRKVSTIGGYLLNIYFRPLLHAFDMASDGSSAVTYWNTPGLNQFGWAVLAINLFYRFGSTFSIWYRFPKMKNLTATLIRQFLDVEVIYQAATSHNDGYQHYFYVYLKQSEAILEGVPQSMITLWTLMNDEYREILVEEGSFLIILGSFVFSFLTVVLIISDSDQYFFKNPSEARFEYIQLRLGTCLRFFLRFCELSISLIVYVFVLNVNILAFLIPVCLILSFAVLIFFLENREIHESFLDAYLNSKHSSIVNLTKWNKLAISKHSSIDRFIFFADDFVNVFTSLLFQVTLFSTEVSLDLSCSFWNERVPECDLIHVAFHKSNILRHLVWEFQSIPFEFHYRKDVQRLSLNHGTSSPLTAISRIFLCRFMIFFLIFLLAAPFQSNFQLTWIIFLLLLVFSISFWGVLKLIKNDIQPGTVGALGFNQSLGRTLENSRMLTELLIVGDTTNHNVYHNSLPYAILTCPDCSYASARRAVEDFDDLSETDESGMNALMKACSYGKKEVVSLLIEYNASLEAKAEDGMNALMCACQAGKKEVASLLIEHNVSLETVDIFGMNALMCACQAGKKEVASLLIEHNVSLEAWKERPLVGL